MPHKPDTPCSGDCGKMLWSGRNSRPAGDRYCQDCRRLGKASKVSDQICSVSSCTNNVACKELCHTHYSRLRTVGDIQADKPIHKLMQCEVCNEPFKKTYKEQRACDRWCGYFLRWGHWPQSQICWCKRCNVIPNHIKHDHPKSLQYRQRKTSGDCERCGVELNSKRGKRFCDYCSKCRRDTHKRKARYKRRSNMENNATIELIDAQHIYDRDDYICYLCDIPIPEELLGNNKHNLAPTLDHVVPVSNGGQHWQNNVKASHRICNSIKQDFPVSEELRNKCKERVLMELETYVI